MEMRECCEVPLENLFLICFRHGRISFLQYYYLT